MLSNETWEHITVNSPFCDVPSKTVHFSKTQVSLGLRMGVMGTTSERAQKRYRNKVNKHKPEHTESLPPAEPEQGSAPQGKEQSEGAKGRRGAYRLAIGSGHLPLAFSLLQIQDIAGQKLSPYFTSLPRERRIFPRAVHYTQAKSSALPRHWQLDVEGKWCNTPQTAVCLSSCSPNRPLKIY